MTLAVAALAIAAIFMTSSAGLLSRFYDRERLFLYAAESALEIQRSRLESDRAPAIPDTGMVVLLSGWQLKNAGNATISGVSVNVYAAATGDTSGTQLPFVTLIAQTYDASGTRHVRRLDLRRESFSRYQVFVDSFPSGVTHGPGVVGGRLHSNTNWINSASGNSFLDTVTVGGAITGTGTFEINSLLGVEPVPYPVDSTFLRLDTLAAAAGLALTPVSGSGRVSRLEMLAFDADNDSTVEASEGFVRMFDLEPGYDSSYFSVGVDSTRSGTTYYHWNSPMIQNQCGAFYLRSGRWHFFPVSTHRRAWASAVIRSTASTSYPSVSGNGTASSGMMGRINDHAYSAVKEILEQPTARCFPAGSPFLMPSERFTNDLGVVTNTAADLYPWGSIVPAGGWPASAPNGYGGSDTTFTPISRTCVLELDGPETTRCSSGIPITLGRWQAGSSPSGISSNVRQLNTEIPYLRALSSPYNSSSRGVVSVRGSVHLSGKLTGMATLRVSGGVRLIDELAYATAPNSAGWDCSTSFGLVAVADILVARGMTTRLRRIGEPTGGSGLNDFYVHLGSGVRTTLHGTLMSLTGTVGVQDPTEGNQPSNSRQPECPEGEGNSYRANGGCLEVVGGMIMKRYSVLASGTNAGFRYYGTPDRCQNSTRRPPFFPTTNRYARVRTLEVQPNIANTPPKIRSLLLRLKGKSL